MKVILNFVLISLSGFFIVPEIYAALAFGLTLTIGLQLFLKSNDSFMFREWTLFLYATNYLLSPAITYHLNRDLVGYAMKIPIETYFNLAFPGMILFGLGMFILPNKLFSPDFKKVRQATIINERFLLQTTIAGIFLRIFSDVLPGELGFFLYLLAMFRFVGAFSLFATNRKKYIWIVLLVLSIELFYGLKSSMFHDSIMWLFFFVIFLMYTIKPTLRVKLLGAFCLVILILFIQVFKFGFRQQFKSEEQEANLDFISSVIGQSSNSESIIGTDNLLSTLNRGNQAWIFASTVDRMDRYKDFQGLNNVNKYIEAAFLPRFLAPNKLSSGNKEIFNQFSGHTINEGTSMGLGIFADGYIAYGDWGVYIFTFFLGLIFSLTFKLVEKWTKISPFYVLLLLPILNYAVRPDCELQTTINHIVKSIFLFGVLVFFTKKKFTLETGDAKKKLLHLNLMNEK